MNKLTPFLFSILVIVFSQPALANKWSSPDKQQHIAASYTLTMVGSAILMEKYKLSTWESVLYSALGTLALGLVKEYGFDSQSDGDDMTANLIGSASASLIVLSVEF